ncbi:hypothetical protein ACXWOG_09245, partial [Streptococcus pyogenes]
PGSGTDTTETANAEMASKNPPAIFSTVSLVPWGPKDGDFLYNLNESSNEELKKLAEQVPDAQRLRSTDEENFGIPYTVEGYGYVFDSKLLGELFAGADTAKLAADLKASDFDSFRKFTDAVDAFIKGITGASVTLNGNTYTFASEKTDL